MDGDITEGLSPTLTAVVSRTGTVDRVLMSDSHCYSIRKEGNVLFNNTLNTFYLRLYGFIHMVKNHSDSERERNILFNDALNTFYHGYMASYIW